MQTKLNMPQVKRGRSYGVSYASKRRRSPYVPARRRFTNYRSKGGFTRVVKKTLQSLAEKKHIRSVINSNLSYDNPSDDLVTKSGRMIRFPALAKGSGHGDRIGNKISWTSYHHQILLKTQENHGQACRIRMIMYKPKQNQEDLMQTEDLPNMFSFIDTDKYTVFSDKTFMISEYGQKNQNAENSCRVLKLGTKFKNPKTVTFSETSGTRALDGDMHILIISDKNSTDTGVPMISTRSDFYFTDL